MREIKFRGLTATGTWVYGGYVKIKDGANCILSGECDHCESDGKTKNILRFNAVKYKTVGEYTGLKDKNGKEIYEGDKVKCELSYIYLPTKTENFVIEYGKFPYRKVAGFYPFYGTLNGYEVTPLEVIGNTYEHPELLEAKDEKNSI